MSLDPKIVARGYDSVARTYADKFSRELEHKPFDRVMLDWLAARAQGPICDLGCGPGQVAAYLKGRGSSVSGLDLSPVMVEAARALHPGIAFDVADMTRLDGIADGAFGAIGAFYCIIHVAPELVPAALTAMHRVLAPGGWLLLTFHIGEEVRHFDEFLGTRVDLDFVFFTPAQMRPLLQAAGFAVTESIEREPYPDVEVATRRAYLWARKAAA